METYLAYLLFLWVIKHARNTTKIVKTSPSTPPTIPPVTAPAVISLILVHAVVEAVVPVRADRGLSTVSSSVPAVIETIVPVRV